MFPAVFEKDLEAVSLVSVSCIRQKGKLLGIHHVDDVDGFFMDLEELQ